MSSTWHSYNGATWRVRCHPTNIDLVTETYVNGRNGGSYQHDVTWWSPVEGLTCLICYIYVSYAIYMYGWNGINPCVIMYTHILSALEEGVTWLVMNKLTTSMWEMTWIPMWKTCGDHIGAEWQAMVMWHYIIGQFLNNHISCSMSHIWIYFIPLERSQ